MYVCIFPCDFVSSCCLRFIRVPHSWNIVKHRNNFDSFLLFIYHPFGRSSIHPSDVYSFTYSERPVCVYMVRKPTCAQCIPQLKTMCVTFFIFFQLYTLTCILLLSLLLPIYCSFSNVIEKASIKCLVCSVFIVFIPIWLSSFLPPFHICLQFFFIFFISVEFFSYLTLLLLLLLLFSILLYLSHTRYG